MGRGRKERYEKAIHTLNIGRYVTFLGEQSTPEAAYRNAHVLAHPTFYDACSLTTMEGMASGLPTITTRWNGASALISEREGYVLKEPHDVRPMAEAIKALFDQGFRDAMGKHARSKLESYTMDRNAHEMERILSEVCAQSRK
jgi:UDP-glucose:(heptosyl)LPS alpha-1,3-glucosyltransferase